MEDDKLIRFVQGLENTVGASLDVARPGRARLNFYLLCKRLGINNVTDIPETIMEDGVEPRELYLDYKFFVHDNSIEGFTEADLAMAVQLEMRYVIERMSEEQQLKYYR
jgi:hypothetical protein